MFEILVDKTSVGENDVTDVIRKSGMCQCLYTSDARFVDVEYEVTFVEAVWTRPEALIGIFIDLDDARPQ